MLRYTPAVLVLVALVLAGCGGGGGGKPGTAAPDVLSVIVTISPETAEVRPGGTKQFAATVTGTPDIAVTWSVEEAIDGGIVSQTGRYVAPSTEGTCHVRVASRADLTKFDVATITVTSSAPDDGGGDGGGGNGGDSGVTISIVPNTCVLGVYGKQQFVATVAGTSNTSVTWSVVEASGGTITQAGLYTAPGVVGEYHVKVTSQADPTKSATANVFVIGGLPPMPPG